MPLPGRCVLPRFLTVLLVVSLMLCLCVPASALDIQTCSQSLTVDGAAVTAEAYNIDGANYVRLRDVAGLLSNTEACFSVSYVQESDMIVIETGVPYIPAETDSAAELAANPVSVVPSPQTLIVSGRVVSGISAYNIDGSNFYKLRELGAILGFGVDYDAESRTVLICTRQETALPEDWSPDIRFTTLDTDGNSWTDACFADARLTMINLWAYWDSSSAVELPALQQLQEDYSDSGLQILGISYSEDEEDNKRLLSDLDITYPCLQYTFELDSYMNTGYLPTTIFVDGLGHVVGETYTGSQGYDGWSEIVDRLLQAQN